MLAGTPAHEPDIVARMEVFSLVPEGPWLEALEEQWIDQHLCPGLVTVHKAILEAQRMRRAISKQKAKDLLQLQQCSEADIYLHRSFLRALPLWLDRQGAGYPLYDLLKPIREHRGWPAYKARLLWCSRSQEQERQASWEVHPMRRKVLHQMPLMPPLPEAAMPQPPPGAASSASQGQRAGRAGSGIS